MAVCTSGAVFPIGLLMCWTRLNKVGAILGVIGGLAMGMVGWLVTAVTTQGSITVITLTDSKVILAGSLSALGTGAIIPILLSLIKPASFDFELTRAIGRGVTVLDRTTAATGPTEKQPQHSQGPIVEAKNSPYEPALDRIEGGGRAEEAESHYTEEIVKLEASQSRFRIITGIFLLVIREYYFPVSLDAWLTVSSVVLIPAPLAGTAVVYPRGLFVLQCVAAATFVFVSLLLITFVSTCLAPGSDDG